MTDFPAFLAFLDFIFNQHLCHRQTLYFVSTATNIQQVATNVLQAFLKKTTTRVDYWVKTTITIHLWSYSRINTDHLPPHRKPSALINSLLATFLAFQIDFLILFKIITTNTVLFIIFCKHYSKTVNSLANSCYSTELLDSFIQDLVLWYFIIIRTKTSHFAISILNFMHA